MVGVVFVKDISIDDGFRDVWDCFLLAIIVLITLIYCVFCNSER